MSREKETEGQEEREDLRITDDDLCEQWVLVGNCGDNLIVSSNRLPPRKKRFAEASQRANPNWADGFSSTEGRRGGSASPGVEPQDADYSFVPSLSDELEVLIVARVPRAEYWKFYLLNKRFLSLLKSGELFKIRREIGFREPSVFMLASGDSSWWAFDRHFQTRRKLPELPSDPCFKLGDKESLCAGTHLIVSGNEIEGGVIWRYELETNNWFKGPSMRRPRCLFASATCGTFAFVAGGHGMDGNGVLNSAERYNPETKSWDSLPGMRQRRKLCSGCYMDNKFYVIGGRSEKDRPLTCGEAYDEYAGTWYHIPDMLKDFPAETGKSPPLIAVVNNELYSLETSSNELRVYLKNSNSWKNLGLVPVRADFNRGWGIAFKSLGNELLVIGASSTSSHESMAIYTCCPSSDAGELQWRLLECGKRPLSHFIHNCSVMVA